MSVLTYNFVQDVPGGRQAEAEGEGAQVLGSGQPLVSWQEEDQKARFRVAMSGCTWGLARASVPLGWRGQLCIPPKLKTVSSGIKYMEFIYTPVWCATHGSGGGPLLYPGSFHAGSEEALFGLPGVLAKWNFYPLTSKKLRKRSSKPRG